MKQFTATGKRRGRAAFPLCPERDARSPHQPLYKSFRNKRASKVNGKKEP